MAGVDRRHAEMASLPRRGNRFASRSATGGAIRDRTARPAAAGPAALVAAAARRGAAGGTGTWLDIALADDFAQSCRKLIDLVGAAEWPGADARGAVGKSAQRPVNVRCAVHPRPNGDVE